MNRQLCDLTRREIDALAMQEDTMDILNFDSL